MTASEYIVVPGTIDLTYQILNFKYRYIYEARTSSRHTRGSTPTSPGVIGMAPRRASEVWVGVCLLSAASAGDGRRGIVAPIMTTLSSNAPPPTTTYQPPLDPRLRISGDLMQYHKVVVDVTGPDVYERQFPNPFSHHRLDATFTLQGDGTDVAVDVNINVTVPGFFAADGNAAHTSASAGNVWRKLNRLDTIASWPHCPFL